MAWVEDKLKHLLRDPECVRNVTIIAHVDHGKTTLSDSLLQRAGLLSADKSGTACALDTQDQEQERGITIASTSIALPLDIQADYTREDASAEHETKGAEAAPTRPLLLNLIDSPGHSDFNSEVTAALRLTDGAVVVVDASEGVLAQTETVLRQAISEGVRPCLFVNKVDRLISELQLTPGQAVDTIMRTVESVNSVIATYAPPSEAAKFTVSFAQGTVGVGSGYYGWGFTADTLAMLYNKAKAHSAQEVRAMFADRKSSDKTRKATRKAMVRLGLKPVCDLMAQVEAAFKGGYNEAAMKKVWKRLAKLGCQVRKPKPDASGVLSKKKAMKAALRSFTPVAESVLYMVSYYLPSPVEAQAYRALRLYTGPSDDETARSIEACSKDGPLVVYVSKMVPVGKKSKGFIACGRVYSGTVRPGQKVLVLPAQATAAHHDGDDESKSASPKVKAYPAVVQRVVALLGAKHIVVDEVPCGNVVGLIGMDKHLLKCGTITDAATTWPMKAMTFSVSPVVRMALKAPKQHQSSQLHNAVRAYSKTDPCVQYFVDPETHELVLAGAGELHLEVAVTSIGLLTGFGPPVVSQPVVSYRETVGLAGPTVLAKTSNKLNRLFVRATPLDDGLVWRLESGAMDVDDAAATSRVLTKEYGWDASHAKKIWGWAGAGDGDGSGPTNVLVDCTTSAQNLPAIKANVLNAFRQVCDAGGVASERLRGVRFDIMDALVHRDSAHRGPSQIVPAACRVFKAAQLCAEPALVQPMFRVTAQVPEKYFGAIQGAISGRSGVVDDVQSVESTPLLTIGGTMPVAKSFGFAGDVRGLSSGRACAAMQFDSWKVVDGLVWTTDASATTTKKGRKAGAGGAGAGTTTTPQVTSGGSGDAAEIAKAIRERKSLPPAVPSGESLCDTL